MGPILDMIAMVLENISTNTIVARTTISAVHRTVQIISCIPNISYHKKASELAYHVKLCCMLRYQKSHLTFSVSLIFSFRRFLMHCFISCF